jgi:hypothetical protein
MTFSPLDFSAGAVAPYLLAFLLLLRRHFRKDGSGNIKQAADPFAQTALYLAYVTLLVPIVFVVLRICYVFIPYGTIWVAGLGVLWAGYTLWLQRRDTPPAAVKSADLKGAKAQQLAALAASNKFKEQSARRFGS